MVKAVALLRRKPGLSLEEFRRHYEEVHAPLAKRLFPFMRKYMRNYVTAAPFSPAGQEPRFDCITEEWFDDMEAVRTMMDIYASETGRPIREDEKALFDMAKLEYFFVEEVTLK
ncbi:MAG: EthD family reductase [Chloroflexi bacterium]|nr:EthD family reductase [Chloroflexota bacterium]